MAQTPAAQLNLQTHQLSGAQEIGQHSVKIKRLWMLTGQKKKFWITGAVYFQEKV